MPILGHCLIPLFPGLKIFCWELQGPFAPSKSTFDGVIEHSGAFTLHID